MQAKETKLQDIIEGTKQYIVPLFQRTYSWDKKEWGVLWNDIVELCSIENPRSHFIGSIVNMPTVSVPEGVTKFLLIDGQQRITTIFILLTLIRNRANETCKKEFAEEINNTLLVNPYKKDNDFFKLMPTQVDREVYKNLIGAKDNISENQVWNAYKFFEKKLMQFSLDLEKLKKVITNYFSIVSIVLDPDDNPYLVFESLNAKGRPLTQADLIRNYFFMRIHIEQQGSIYNEYWQPMQNALNENLTEFIRHFLMKMGLNVKQNDVYYVLKERVSQSNAIEYLKELSKFSTYYKKLLDPEFEKSESIKKYLKRLNRIEVTTAYPLLLNFYHYYSEGKLTEVDFVEILKTIENFLIRRFVCSYPTNQLNKIFPTIFPQLIEKYPNKFAEGVKGLLSLRGYPKDHEFRTRFKDAKLYGSGDRINKTKIILETIEEHFAHKEIVHFENLTIEHIMPQTLSSWWQNQLGEDWQLIHELYLHTIGNLTLTAYNTELSNDDFPSKQKVYEESHLELNKYFKPLTKWTKEGIDARSEHLAEISIETWKWFGKDDSSGTEIVEVTGTTPKRLTILGQKFDVSSWRDVLENTLNTVAYLESDKFEYIAENFPHYIGKEKNKFRAIRELQNGYFVEVNLSAQAIQRLCYQAIETIDLTAEEWKIETE